MPSIGPNSPSNAENETSVGSQAWHSPGNVFTSNNSKADSTVTPGDSAVTYLLKATGFGFSVPAGSTINGVVVQIEKAQIVNEVSSSVTDNTVKIVKGGSIVGSNKASGSDWPSGDAYISYGGASDLWGTSLTPDDVNASNFGVVVAASIFGAGIDQPTAEIDHIRITVHYTLGAGSGSAGSMFAVF